jgi:cell division protein FtsQ
VNRRTVIVLVAIVLVAGAWAVPESLQRMSFFRVRQVELIGVRYLAPDSVLAHLGLSSTQNLFDDAGAIEARVAQIAGVVSAQVDRKLPGTLRVTIVEQMPVAFAPGAGRLVAMNGDGQALPYDPVESGLDLPMVARPDSLLLRALAVVRTTDSTVFRDVDGARRRSANRGNDVVLEMNGRRVLLDGVPTPDDVRTVSAVRRHLAQSGRSYRELDTRYQGWVVVRRGGT